jgi:hypothetical protein
LSESDIPVTLKEECWQQGVDPSLTPGHRLGFLAGLAAFDTHSGRWESVAGFVSSQLAGQPSVDFPYWKELFRPVGRTLSSALDEVYTDTTREIQARSQAGEALLDYSHGDHKTAYNLLAEAPPALLSRMKDACRAHQEQCARLAMEEFRGACVQPVHSQPTLRIRRVANLFVFLLHTSLRSSAWSELARARNVDLRSLVIHLQVEARVDPGVAFEALREERDPWVRSALYQTLGTYLPETIGAPARKAWAAELLANLPAIGDPECRASLAWLLGRWGVAVPAYPTHHADSGVPQESGMGARFTVLDTTGIRLIRIAGKSPIQTLRPNIPGIPAEDMDVSADFWISDTEVTRKQFQQYSQGPHPLSDGHGPSFTDVPLDPEDPVTGVSWHEAAKYCNWLSQTAGMPESEWIYSSVHSGGDKTGMVEKPSFRQLKGFRLPLSSEWRHACGAGTRTAFSFGNRPSLLGHYAWFSDNSDNRPWPVHSLKPNGWGLFGMHGNAMEWCHEVADGSSIAPGPEQSSARGKRQLCGGSFSRGHLECQTHAWNTSEPGVVHPEIGFRVMRRAD